MIAAPVSIHPVLPSIEAVKLSALVPGQFNPRRNFNAETIKELAASIKARGQQQPILVRPRGPFRMHEVNRVVAGGWEITDKAGSKLYFRDDLDKTEALRIADVLLRRHWEIVAGERRWRALRLLGAEFALAIVRQMDDVEAAEMGWIENLHREDLDPIDESRGFQQMLKMRDSAGRVIYASAEEIAKRIGKTHAHVRNFLALEKLPDVLSRSVSEGDLPYTVAALVGALPTPELREKVAQHVLHPPAQTKPLTHEQTEDYIRTEVCRSLGAATFNREDPALITGVPACGACPYNSVNLSSRDFGRLPLCTNPECFRAKTIAAWQQVTAPLVAEGKDVLTFEESETIYPPRMIRGEMALGCPWVELAWKPEPFLIKVEVLYPPTWRQLIGDIAVPLIYARDQTGRIVELADRKLCIEAAFVNDEQNKTNESAIFKDSQKKVPKSVRAKPPEPPPSRVPAVAAAPASPEIEDSDAREDNAAAADSEAPEFAPAASPESPFTPHHSLFRETIHWHRYDSASPAASPAPQTRALLVAGDRVGEAKYLPDFGGWVWASGSDISAPITWLAPMPQGPSADTARA